MSITYNVLHSSNLDDLIFQVNNLLSIGWTLVGGVSIAYNPLLEPVPSDHIFFAQALSLTTHP